MCHKHNDCFVNEPPDGKQENTPSAPLLASAAPGRPPVGPSPAAVPPSWRAQALGLGEQQRTSSPAQPLSLP